MPSKSPIKKVAPKKIDPPIDFEGNEESENGSTSLFSPNARHHVKPGTALPIPGPAGQVLGPTIVEGDSDAGKVKAAVDSLYSRENLAQKGNLKRHQLVHLIRGAVYAQQFKCPLMLDVVMAVIELSISDGGIGRKDMRTVLQAMLARRQEPLGPAETQLQRRLMG